MERLQKVIAQSGYASRRKAEELIEKGKVYVNGKKITTLGTKVNQNDNIIVDGVELKQSNKVYFLLNKPRGIISSVKDEHNRKTVVDLIDTNERIFPVGRLDYDTTGIILLTNDGELSNRLTHPSKQIPKKYLVRLNKILSLEDLKKLKEGINVEGKKCVPTKVRIKKNDLQKEFSMVEITITEGRNHIIKKVFMNLGYLVDKLSRIEYSFLTLDKLKSGQYRNLSIKEVKKLYDISR